MRASYGVVDRSNSLEMRMDSQTKMGRRDFRPRPLCGGAWTALGSTGSPTDAAPLPQGIHFEDPLAQYRNKSVSHLIDVKLPPEISLDGVKERHRIFSLLLMALIVRFWNGNNNGPLGIYPQREGQKAAGQNPNADSFRYRGDLNESDTHNYSAGIGTLDTISRASLWMAKAKS